jgi:hypothetical protein
VVLTCLSARAAAKTAFDQRGFYLLPCRTPTLGYDVYRDLVDDLATDGVNTVILWLAGAFRSRRFPITWQYNAEHLNIRDDYMLRLIEHAQQRGIRCLLGFTPFGYDGVNQYPLEHPELKAVGPDGKPVNEFGIHCWGWNLCPAQLESQRFMLEYIREMAFEFYPNADGLFIESSDYAICHCPQCGVRHFDHEFKFVQTISDEIWARRPNATVVVYPHYFSGAKLKFAFSEAVATRQPFDSRWTLFFTPHSAALEPDLIRRARGSWWWNEAPSRFDIPAIREGVRKAREANCTGFLPSLECYSYIETHEEFGEPWLKGQRQAPFGFGWLKEGASPYRELPVRMARIAYREYSRNPDLSDADLQSALGLELFGEGWTPPQVEDARDLCRVLGTDRGWTVPAPLTAPGLVEFRRRTGRLNEAKRLLLRQQLEWVQAIAARHRNTQLPGARDLGQIADWISRQWEGANADVLQ